MNIIITKIQFIEYGEPQQIIVGHQYDVGKCIKITEKAAMGDGDKWFWDAEFENGSIKRIFNPLTVDFVSTTSQVKEEYRKGE